MKYPILKKILVFVLGMVTFAVGSFIVSTFIFVERPIPPGSGTIYDYERICFHSDMDGITAVVSPKGCFSTTCTWPKVQAGTAIIDVQEYKIQLETQFMLVETVLRPKNWTPK